MSGTTTDNKSNTSLILTNNNRLVFAAIKFYFGGPTWGTYSTFFKTDLSGSIIFSKTFRNPDDAQPADIIETIDGDFIITGHTHTIDTISNVFSFILKTDSLGNVLWSKATIDSSGTYGLKVVMPNDTICFGTSTYYNPITGSDIYYYAVNANGDIKFEKLLKNNGNESGRSLLANAGKVYLLGNTINSFDSINEFLMVKLDLDGNPIWKYRYHFSNSASYLEGLFITKKNDNTLTVGGTIYDSQQDFFLCEIDTNGNVLNSKIYDIEFYDDITSLSSDSNSGYLVNCLSKSVTGQAMFTGISIDSNLNVTNSKKVLNSHYGFGTQGPTMLKADSMIYLGGIQYNNNPIAGTPFIMGLDSNFDTGCASQPCIVNSAVSQVISYPIGFFSYEGSVNILQPKNIFSEDILINDSSYCITLVGESNTLNESNSLVFPNPSSGEIKIEFPLVNLENNIEIIDITGKIMMKAYLTEANKTINISMLDNGIYFIRLRQNNSVVNRKFVLIK
jgi:hypothetical protein